VIGMACRLPGANDEKEFWSLLIEKAEAIVPVPEWRWSEEQVDTLTDEAKKMQAGFLKCPVDEFDAKFFGMSPEEMNFTDPQQRLLLEVSWEALENSLVNPMTLQGTQTGIFTGTWLRDYVDMLNILRSEEDKEFFRSYMGNSFGATAGSKSQIISFKASSKNYT